MIFGFIALKALLRSAPLKILDFGLDFSLFPFLPISPISPSLLISREILDFRFWNLDWIVLSPHPLKF